MSGTDRDAQPVRGETTLAGADLPETFYQGRGRARPLPSLFDLTGAVAVVTGAGGGLGTEFATALAEAGATVVCADLDHAGAKRTAEHVRGLGGTALDLALDVTDEAAVDEAFAGVVRDLGGIDVLVNNAGIGDPRSVPLHRVRTEDWQRVLDINLGGIFFCSRAALRSMVKRRSGKIINVASMYGVTGSRVRPIPGYATAKGAVVNLTREVGLQYAASRIQVNALCPGFVRTGLSGGVYENREFLETLVAAVPMGRVAEAHELRGALLLLASSASDYMTGQTLVVDGGCVAG